MRVLLLLIDTGRGSPEASYGQQSPGAPKLPSDGLAMDRFNFLSRHPRV